MRNYNVKCCVNIKPLTTDYNDPSKVIKSDYKQLCGDYNNNKTESSHLYKLNDSSKQLEDIFHEKCYYPLKRIKKTKIQIVDKDDHLAKTRTEQLALPKPSTLEELQKREAFQYFDNIRKNQTNRLYRKSVLSVYSRFRNAKKPQEIPKSKKLDDASKERLKNHLEILAKPKKDFSKLSKESKVSNASKSLYLQRIKQLSAPKIKNPEPKNKKWKLTKAIKNYKPTERLCELSKPKVYDNIDYERAFKVQPKALTYQASSRIKQLAKPQKLNTKIVQNNMESQFTINERALKAKTTERINQLACPRDYIDVLIKANPFTVSKAALKAKASKRIQELAQSKTNNKK